MAEAKQAMNLETLVSRYDSLRREEKMDLSSGEDLSIAIMNLISIEEHLFFTSQKLGKDAYLELLNDVRTMRVSLLKRLVTNPEGEEWCISKHLLAASYRLMEVGTKNLSLGRNDDARSLFGQSFELYSMFWGIALKHGESGLRPTPAEKTHEAETGGKKPKSKWTSMVKKVIDCCIE